MIEIIGQYNTAKCFTGQLEDGAREQIKSVCDTEAFASSKIRIMPDVHAGKGCTIGTTMTITDKIVPSMVGVDIGCGMYTVYLGQIEVDFEKIDEAAHYIPCGRSVWDAVWYRLRSHEELPPDCVVVHGHTPTYHYQEANPLSINYGVRRIGIDCGSGFPDMPYRMSEPQGRLACLRLDDMTEFYSEETENNK